MNAVVGVFESMAAAVRAVAALERQNYPRSDIRIVADRIVDPLDAPVTPASEFRAGARAGVGTGGLAGVAAGGALGVLATLGVLAPTGCDPLLAVGPLFAIFILAAIGAAGGMLAGGLVGLVIRHRDPEGGARVSVRTEDVDPGTITDILEGHGATHVDQHHEPHAAPVARVRRVVVDATVKARVAEDVLVERETRRPDAATPVALRSDTGPMRSRTKILTEPRSPADRAYQG